MDKIKILKTNKNLHMVVDNSGEVELPLVVVVPFPWGVMALLGLGMPMDYKSNHTLQTLLACDTPLGDK